jgi:hypothetical protein
MEVRMPGEQRGRSRERAWRWWTPLAGASLLAALGVVLHPVARRHAREASGRVAQAARAPLEGSAMLAREGVRHAGRLLALPADRALELAREHVVAGLPEASDTKWRVASLVVRAMIASAVREGPERAGALLDDAGRAYADASTPSAGWDALTLREAVRRLLRSLEIDGDVRREDATVEVVTTGCAPLEAAEPADRAAICETVCGERLSLLHGLATQVGARIESPSRMGEGRPYCLRRLVLPGR